MFLLNWCILGTGCFKLCSQGTISNSSSAIDAVTQSKPNTLQNCSLTLDLLCCGPATGGNANLKLVHVCSSRLKVACHAECFGFASVAMEGI